MYEVFNMGCGFVCVVAAADAEAAVQLLRGHYPGAKRIGTVTQRDGVVERLGGEGAAVGGRRRRGRATEVLAQRRCRAEPRPRRDLLDVEVGVLEQPARLEHALGVEPPKRRGPRLGDEAAGERARADRRAASERRDVQRLVEVVQRPAPDGLERIVARRLGAAPAR